VSQDNIAKKAQKSSKKARSSAARLAAVQAVYQMLTNDQVASVVTEEFLSRRLGKPVDGIDMVVPDGTLFKSVVNGVETRKDDLIGLIKGAQKEGKSISEPLLNAILLCGAYELLAHHDTDTPLVIAEYLHVTQAFYDQGESKLVNGILDHIGKSVR